MFFNNIALLHTVGIVLSKVKIVIKIMIKITGKYGKLKKYAIK